MAKINYANKVALNSNSDIADINKCNATDMNLIKEVVNELIYMFGLTKGIFSESETYAVKDFVTNDYILYKCHTAVTTAGAWTGSANWSEASIVEYKNEMLQIDKDLINGKWEDIPSEAFSYHTNLSLKSAKYNPLTKEVWLRLYGNNNGVSNGTTIVTFSDIKYIPTNKIDVTNCGGGLWTATQNTSSIPALIAFATIETSGTVKVFYQADAPLYFSGIEIRYVIN